jgi:crossover junction endodeoxyribonuclease RuvC
MLILGIDPGLATTGWGVIEQYKIRLRYVDHGVFSTKAGLPLPERLLDISKQLERLLAQLKPARVAVEELFFAKNTKTAMLVSQARGVILATIAQRGCELLEFTPLQIKQALTGFGRADKKQVEKMTSVILGMKQLKGPDDAIDALAAAICAAHTVKVKSKQ